MSELSQEDIQKMQQFESMKKNLIRRLLTKDAIERLGRIKIVKSESDCNTRTCNDFKRNHKYILD